MISTKQLVTSSKSVPDEWIFEYYLGLNERLCGQNIKILSAFNSKDKVPSMFIYIDSTTGGYKFKDFSSGHQGKAINLVEKLFNINFNQARNKVVTDYEQFLVDNTYKKVHEFVIHDKYKVVDWQIRHWTNQDQAYWMKFKIGSKLLDFYNVSPLEFFTMEKTDIDGSISSVTFNNSYTYGYFREDGSIYKIYMPKNQEKKFIKVENYIQGFDQLRGQPNLVITSSLKDLMAFTKLGFKNIEAIAPDSENSMISEMMIEKFKKKYNFICVLFDNDEPGIAAMQKYTEKYGFPAILLPMAKDLSDSVKEYGIDSVRETLLPLLKQAS